MAETALDLSAKSHTEPEFTDTRENSNFHASPKSESGRSSIFSNSDTDINSGPENSPIVKSMHSTLPSESVLEKSANLEHGIHDRSIASISAAAEAAASSFRSYPQDALSFYTSPLMAHGMSLNPALAGLGSPTLMDSSVFPGFPMTPLTSHLLQRKRRSEPRTPETCELDPKKTNPVPEEKKDDAYWERRRKNNEAAKRSRDTRRQKEDEIAMRAAYLEQENLKLRAQVALLKNETSKLHYMLYNRL